MNDEPEEKTEWHDTCEVGQKIEEMMDRAKAAHLVHPQAMATWGVVDAQGTHFQVIVKVLDE